MMFPDQLLAAIGAWQNGWREDQSRRELLANQLEFEASGLPEEFRTELRPCFRKRFLHKGELVDVILNDERNEGVTSWTTELAYAERFKGVLRQGAVSGAIFEHTPKPGEVIVNIAALWASTVFVEAVEDYSNRGGEHAKALLNFRDSQGEVVLKAPLRGSEIIALTGASSPFDELCDRAGIPIEKRDVLFSQLVKSGVYPGEVAYTTAQGARNAISNTIQKMRQKLLEIGVSI